MPPTLHVLRAGVHTTVQDAGRWGLQHLGVPVGGALDLEASRRANLLVGNAPDEATLEVTLTGCTLRVSADVHVAVTGARFVMHALDDGGAVPGVAVTVPMNAAVLLRRATTLVMGERQTGARAYVAVRGGLEAASMLGSRSAWPLLERRGALRDGDTLAIADRAVTPVMGRSLAEPAYRDVLRVLAGPEATPRHRVLGALCSETGYRIADTASRMAYPLEDGPIVPLSAPSRPSSGTVTGALQVLPSGLPVLLMAERQTTGGYPVAAVVIAADLGHAAQLPPGARLRFVPCTRAEAVRALTQVDRGVRR